MTVDRTQGSAPTLVVVGNGMTGYALCDKLVQLGGHQEYRIVVYGEEPRPAYDRVHLTQFFSGATPQSLELAPRSWYDAHGIELLTNERVTEIRRDERTVVSSSGCAVPYDKLVLATGSNPFVPPIEGTDLEGVFVYRTIEDVEAIRDYSARAKSAAVIGGGLLGLEAARALYDLGFAAHVVEMAPSLMPRQLDADSAALLQQKVEALGVQVHTLESTSRICRRGSRLQLEFASGRTLHVDMVVISAGIRPRDELARASGLEVGERGGIVVNDQLQTSDECIFAVGECALHRGIVYGLAAPCYRMAEVLAQRLSGQDATFEQADQSACLKLLGVDVETIGRPLGEAPDTRIVAARSEAWVRKLILRDGQLVGAMAVGPWPEAARIRASVDQAYRPSSWRLHRFERTGRLWGQAAALDVTRWPDDAIVCTCKNVRRAALTAAVRDGCTTVDALTDRTGASTGCGSCRILVAQMVGQRIEGRAVFGWRSLLVTSIAAIALTAAISVARPLPIAQTVQDAWHRLDLLWRISVYRQISGFSILGMAVVALSLSLRKRIPRFHFGSVGFWRVVHSGLGLMTVVGLIVHTGMRLGSNLNFALAASFLALVVLGAFAGVLAALESHITGAGAMLLRQWRGRLTLLHILLFWPLPVLLGFHILSVYYF